MLSFQAALDFKIPDGERRVSSIRQHGETSTWSETVLFFSKNQGEAFSAKDRGQGGRAE